MKILIIFGPTATGKTDIALKVAKNLNGEIISADSRQVYKSLDIGTGKLSKNLTTGHKIQKAKHYWKVDAIKIHGFDLANPGENFSVADFIFYAKTKINKINKIKKLPIIAGGTGFYIKSLINPPQTLTIIPNYKLRNSLQNYSAVDLFHKLNTLDPKKAKTLNNSDKNNPRRLIRAIEVALSLKKKSPKLKPVDEYLILGLTAKNELLYSKVNDWIDFRLKNGLEKEVVDLMKKIDPQWLIALGLEYRWVTRYLNREISKTVAVNRLKGDTHKLIRTQKNWFDQFPKIKLFDITTSNWQNKFEKTVSLWYTNAK